MYASAFDWFRTSRFEQTLSEAMAFTFLITGGAGFIGSHLTLSLLQDNQCVKVLDNFSSRSRSEFEELTGRYRSSLQIIDDDIRDRLACKKAVESADYVLHLAAMASVPASIAAPDECVSINILGTTNLLEETTLAGHCQRFVFASSSAVYGDCLPVLKSEDVLLDPLSPYATSKLAGEYLCRNFATIHRLPTVSLRYFNVYGQRQNPDGPYSAVIPRFIEAITAGRQPLVYGDGEQSRDFVSVSDVVSANLCACFARSPAVAGRSFNIGSGIRTTLNDLINSLSTITGTPITANYLPERLGDIKHSLADISRSKEQLGYSPTVSFEDGMRGLLK